MFVFRIDGRVGQGVYSAARILGRAGFLSGFKVQDFIIGDANKRGLHVTGFVKLDKGPILSRQLEMSDFLIVMDKTLDINNIIKNAKDGSVVILNSNDKIKLASLKKRGIKNYHVDATAIALGRIKKAYPNTAMLGALIKSFSKLSLKSMKKAVEIELDSMQEENKALVEEGYRNVRR
jgi:pyruvate ferredoxin oxidoreductase gamma subunit